MGYCIRQVGASFRISADKKQAALNAVKAMDPEVLGGRGRGDGKKQFAGVEQETVKEANTLEEALREWSYAPKTDYDGNIVYIWFDGEKMGQETILFNVIAPFVDPGSYIEMSGEDGGSWRWVFDGTKCKEVTPTVSWDEDE